MANCLMNLELGFSYLGVEFLRAFVSLIHTTNLLERFHTEIQRKQQDIGMFQRERGCDALWYLIITWETAKPEFAVASYTDPHVSHHQEETRGLLEACS
ncbi:MAG: hypothetical protein ACREOH_19840 [Candidatus Entotheonellia bacterium]